MVRPLSALFSSSTSLLLPGHSTAPATSSPASATHPDPSTDPAAAAHAANTPAGQHAADAWVVPVYTQPADAHSSAQKPRADGPERAASSSLRAPPHHHHQTPHRSLSLSHASHDTPSSARRRTASNSNSAHSYRASNLLEAGSYLDLDSPVSRRVPPSQQNQPPPPPLPFSAAATLTPTAPPAHRHSRSLGGPVPPPPLSSHYRDMDPNRIPYSPGAGHAQYVYAQQQQQQQAGSPMRRGTSYEGAGGAAAGIGHGGRILPPLSLTPGGSGSPQAQQLGGIPAASVASGLMGPPPVPANRTGAGGSPHLVPMAASPSLRAYSPSDYASAQSESGHAPPPPAGAGYGMQASPGGNASSYYPRHIAQSYSPNLAGTDNLLGSPSSASPFFSAQHGANQQQPQQPPQQSPVTSSSPYSLAANPGPLNSGPRLGHSQSYHLPAQHQQPQRHSQSSLAAHGHAYSYSGHPGSSTSTSPLALSPTPLHGHHSAPSAPPVRLGPAFSPVGMGTSGSMRDLSLAGSAGAAAAAGAGTSPSTGMASPASSMHSAHSYQPLGPHHTGQQHTPQQAQAPTFVHPHTYAHAQAGGPRAPRKKKGLQRVGGSGEEIVTAGTTQGGQPRERRADPNGGWVSVSLAFSSALG